MEKNIYTQEEEHWCRGGNTAYSAQRVPGVAEYTVPG